MDYNAFIATVEKWKKHLVGDEISLEQFLEKSKLNERYRNVCVFYSLKDSENFATFLQKAQDDILVKEMLVNLYHSLKATDKETQNISELLWKQFFPNLSEELENEQPTPVITAQMVKVLRSMVRQYHLEHEYSPEDKNRIKNEYQG
ncbi:hypothetical protein [Ammoniphilus sp. 3BR4]|uniref:hypothetical protein n=1 Tax=Ammoniphilus sp. 3BR4 TaxID=3158265 RepID=UPI00346609FC